MALRAALALAAGALLLPNAGRAVRVDGASEEDEPLCNDGTVCCSSGKKGTGEKKCKDSCTDRDHWFSGNLYPHKAAGLCKVSDLVWHAEKGEIVHEDLLSRFLSAQNGKFRNEGNNLVEINVGTAGTVFVVGDLHGTLDQLLYAMRRIRDMLALPLNVAGSNLLVCIPGLHYVFLGDYVDRGPASLQTVSLVLAYRALCPSGVILLRGNHEDVRVNQKYGFASDVKKMNSDLLYQFEDAWETLPVAATINKQVLLVHGGLAPWLSESTSYDLFKSRFAMSSRPERKKLMWNDPAGVKDKTRDGWAESNRGSSFQKFDATVMEDFSEHTNIQLLIRGHQVQPKGHSISFGGSLLSLHTMANYDNSGNYGAFARIKGIALHDATTPHRRPDALIKAISIYPHVVSHGQITPLDETSAEVHSLLQQSQLSMSALMPAGLQDMLNTTLEEYCKNILTAEHEDILQQPKESFDSCRTSSESEEILAMCVEIRIDELGEADVVEIGEPGERMKKSCEALLQTEALRALLEQQETVKSSEESVLEEEVNTKRSLARDAKKDWP